MKYKIAVFQVALMALAFAAWAGPVEFRPQADITLHYDATTGITSYSTSVGGIASVNPSTESEGFPLAGPVVGPTMDSGANQVLMNGKPLGAPVLKSAVPPRPPTTIQVSPVAPGVQSAQGGVQ